MAEKGLTKIMNDICVDCRSHIEFSLEVTSDSEKGTEEKYPDKLQFSAYFEIFLSLMTEVWFYLNS